MKRMRTFKQIFEEYFIRYGLILVGLFFLGMVLSGLPSDRLTGNALLLASVLGMVITLVVGVVYSLQQQDVTAQINFSDEQVFWQNMEKVLGTSYIRMVPAGADYLVYKSENEKPGSQASWICVKITGSLASLEGPAHLIDRLRREFQSR
jgi:hypothetical protein